MLRSLLLIWAVAFYAQAMAEAVPAETAVASSQRDTLSLTFDRNRRKVPIEYIQGCIAFQAEVAGRNVWVLLDSGAARSVIDTQLAAAGGLTIEPANGTIRTIAGEVPRRRVRNVSIALPGQFSGSLSMAAVDLAQASQAAARKIEAVFGHDLLSVVAVAAYRREGLINFAPSGTSITQGPGVNVTLIPITRVGDLDQINVKVGNRQLTLTLDSGLDYDVSLAPAAWERVKPNGAQVFDRSTTSADGRQIATRGSRLPSLIMGGITLNDLNVSVHPWPEAYRDGAIGIGLLSRNDFLLDIGAHRLYLVASGRP